VAADVVIAEFGLQHEGHLWSETKETFSWISSKKCLSNQLSFLDDPADKFRFMSTFQVLGCMGLSSRHWKFCSQPVFCHCQLFYTE